MCNFLIQLSVGIIHSPHPCGVLTLFNCGYNPQSSAMWGIDTIQLWVQSTVLIHAGYLYFCYQLWYAFKVNNSLPLTSILKSTSHIVLAWVETKKLTWEWLEKWLPLLKGRWRSSDLWTHWSILVNHCCGKVKDPVAHKTWWY